MVETKPVLRYENREITLPYLPTHDKENMNIVMDIY